MGDKEVELLEDVDVSHTRIVNKEREVERNRGLLV